MPHYDLVIVGAGLFGLSSACHALKQSKRVLLIEAGTASNNASVRNFGQIVPSGQSLHGWRYLGIESIAHYRDWMRLADIPAWQQGSWYLASDDEELALIEELYQLDKEGDDHPQEYSSVLKSREEVLSTNPALKAEYIKGALYYPQDISADSPGLLPKLLQFLRRDANFQYLNRHLITGIVEKNAAVTLTASNGASFSASQALVCCGHWLNRVMADQMQIPTMKICKLQMMSTQPMSGMTLKGNILSGLSIRRYEAFHHCPSFAKLANNPELSQYNALGIHILFKQSPDGSLIIGDSHEYFDADEVDTLDFRNNELINKIILGEAARILPVGQDNIIQRWNGYYSLHDDGILLDSPSDNIHLMTGIGGKGMTCIPALAERIVKRILARGPLGMDLVNQTSLV